MIWNYGTGHASAAMSDPSIRSPTLMAAMHLHPHKTSQSLPQKCENASSSAV